MNEQREPKVPSLREEAVNEQREPKVPSVTSFLRLRVSRSSPLSGFPVCRILTLANAL